jgi:16S rRNA (cytosine967-C5)-methyltransferase
MDPRALAARVIKMANREHPADAVLRKELRAASGIKPEEAAKAARAVFAFYRWRGWLGRAPVIPQQIQRALELADRFGASPESFADDDLLQKAVPEWIWRELEPSAVWVRSLQREPAIWLRAQPGEGRRLSNRLGQCRAFGEGALGDTLKYEGEQDLFHTREFHRGLFELQDLNSQAVGMICDPKPGSTWWDACAGEGGKTLHLSALMRNKGLIWASDRAEWRLRKLKLRAGRAGVFNYRAALWDGGERLPTKTRFDGVLVDAPCAGTGTWQRNPHARWTTTPADVLELSQLQLSLLSHAAPALKPGGMLIYAVCTLTASETRAVAEAFGRQFPDFKREPLRNPLDPGAALASDLYLRPQEHEGNGMYVAAWRRG